MNPELKIIIYEEKKILKKLLDLLDKQYDLIINKDIINMDKIAITMDSVSKELANTEIKRRNIMGNETSMRKIVKDFEDENIVQAYEEIKSTLKMLEIQKDANQLLIKQQMFFTKKMMNFIKPNKGIGTYNASGQVSK